LVIVTQPQRHYERRDRQQERAQMAKGRQIQTLMRGSERTALLGDQCQERLLRLGKLIDPLTHQRRLEVLDVHAAIDVG
jgi:hypothetical protein